MTTEDLQRIVEKEGLQAVADRIGKSKTAVCHVVRGTYKGKPDRVLDAAEEAYSQRIIECPVKGEISYAECVENSRLPFSSVNPIRVRLARTCPRCGHKTGRDM